MKLCSLETPKCTPVSVRYCCGWSMNFLLALHPNQIVSISTSAVMCHPAALWGESNRKTGMTLLCDRDSAGKTAARIPSRWGDLLTDKCPGVFPHWPYSGKLEGYLNPLKRSHVCEWAVHSHWHVPWQARLVSQGETPFPQAVPGWRHPLALYTLSLFGCLLMHKPDGWCLEVKMMYGFNCSLRDFRKIRHLVWGLAWTLKVALFVLQEIGLLASKAATESHYLQNVFCVCLRSTWLLGKGEVVLFLIERVYK